MWKPHSSASLRLWSKFGVTARQSGFNKKKSQQSNRPGRSDIALLWLSEEHIWLTEEEPWRGLPARASFLKTMLKKHCPLEFQEDVLNFNYSISVFLKL